MTFQFLDSLINGPSTSYENTSDNEDESDIDLDESALVDLPDSEDSDSEKDEPRPNNNIETWSDNLTSVTDKLNAFEDVDGGIHSLSIDCSPIDYFRLFINDEMIELMVTETNRYAEQQQQIKGRIDTQWKPCVCW